MAHPRGPLLRLRFATAGIVALAAACGDNGTGPGPMKPADPLATAASIASLDAPFSSEAYESFGLAAAQSPAGVSPLAALRTVLRAARPMLVARTLTSAETRLTAAALRAALVPTSGAGAGSISATVLPPEILGTVYTWSTTTLQYEASSPTGGPPDGVRFILYALDLSGYPVVPLQEIGYADFEDKSTSAVQALRIEVVGTTTDPPVTYVDYTVSATTSTLTVIGFITDGTRKLDFNCALTATSSASATLDIKFDVNADNAHVRLTIKFSFPDEFTTKYGINFRLQFGDEVVTVTGTLTETTTTSGTLTVRVNGGIFATITVADDVPSFAGGGGQELTVDDYTALNAIFDAFSEIQVRFFLLLIPALAVLG